MNMESFKTGELKGKLARCRQYLFLAEEIKTEKQLQVFSDAVVEGIAVVFELARRGEATQEQEEALEAMRRRYTLTEKRRRVVWPLS